MLYPILKSVSESGEMIHWRIFTHVETVYTTLGPESKPVQTTTTSTGPTNREVHYDYLTAAKAEVTAQATWEQWTHRGWCRTEAKAKGMHRMAQLRKRGRRKLRRMR